MYFLCTCISFLSAPTGVSMKGTSKCDADRASVNDTRNRISNCISLVLKMIIARARNKGLLLATDYPELASDQGKFTIDCQSDRPLFSAHMKHTCSGICSKLFTIYRFTSFFLIINILHPLSLSLEFVVIFVVIP